ncbi:Glyceraldehyde-3-phosphate dehydrogenase (phosphorylating) [Bertholletia excelsa]
MANLEEEAEGTPAAVDVTNVAATVVTEAATASAAAAVVASEDPELDTDFQVDPAYTTSEQIQEEVKADGARGEGKGSVKSLETAIIISGAVIAVVGAALNCKILKLVGLIGE